MQKISNDDIIQAVFSASDEAKAQALKILEGRAPMEPSGDPVLLSMGEAAAMMNVSRATLWRILKAGRLKKVELYPGAFRLRRSDIVNFSRFPRPAGKEAAHG
jgi:excisionase family DNA binding protein